MTDEYELIDDETGYRRAMRAISRERRIGLDIESNGFFRYPERVCLVQVSTSDDVFVIDPLALEDVTLLGDLLAKTRVETVVHAGSHDVLAASTATGASELASCTTPT